MESIHIREANSEILIFLDKNMGSRLAALEEAAKIIGRQLLHERTHPDSDFNRKFNRNQL